MPQFGVGQLGDRKGILRALPVHCGKLDRFLHVRHGEEVTAGKEPQMHPAHQQLGHSRAITIPIEHRQQVLDRGQLCFELAAAFGRGADAPQKILPRHTRFRYLRQQVKCAPKQPQSLRCTAGSFGQLRAEQRRLKRLLDLAGVEMVVGEIDDPVDIGIVGWRSSSAVANTAW